MTEQQIPLFGFPNEYVSSQGDYYVCYPADEMFCVILAINKPGFYLYDRKKGGYSYVYYDSLLTIVAYIHERLQEIHNVTTEGNEHEHQDQRAGEERP